MRKDGLPVDGERDRGMKRVALAAEIEQLAARCLHAVGLGEDTVARGQHLVRPDDEGAVRQIAHRFRLGAGEHLGDIARVERPRRSPPGA